MVGKVDVREKREGGAVGAKGRAGGNRTRALAGEAVAGGSAAAEAERRGEEYMRAAVYGWWRQAVSSCLKSSCLARWERRQVEQCTSQRESASSKRPPGSALIVDLSRLGPRFSSLHANLHPPNMLRDRENLATSSSPANWHTLVQVHFSFMPYTLLLPST